MLLACGQPRNGTSMLMRTLKFGGVNICYDTAVDTPRRKRKMRNPHGFFEITKDTPRTGTWKVWRAGGLKRHPEARVIFIQRDLEQVHKSWLAMGTNRDVKVIQRMRDRMEEEVAKHDHVKVSFEQMFIDPRCELERIKAFLHGKFDVDTALTAIDETLHRER